ncbi:MAG: HD domain-containing protein [Bacteroidota bacterium]|nr:HD domain-containing protein [Bacteroidota bacterium]
MANVRKDKIINDPIYGFIKLEQGLIYDLISHPYFQRLRRISQLGLSYLVYPGANHTRFQHAIGSMHLMNQAITQIETKGHKLSQHEKESLKICILLHDIGHGPFSHALEKSIIPNIKHEHLSLLFMQYLNEKYDGKLSLAIKIFQNNYKKKYLHELVDSQLDMDRLDYLKRDSFFSGVVEGNIGTERIINMIDVVNDKLVIEEKGIYSIEQFLIARRLMYWQVYLHKTVVVAENILIQILKRVKLLITNKKLLYSEKPLHLFLKNNFNIHDFKQNPKLLHEFTKIDDYDIYNYLKEWQSSEDFVLSSLCKMILNRNFLKIKIQNTLFQKEELEHKISLVIKEWNLSREEAVYFVFSNQLTNNVYSMKQEKINILMKNGDVCDIAQISNQLKMNISSSNTEKYFLCYPKL